MSGAGTSQTNQNSTPKPVSTFEFTKRKRWADILITGLTDVILFILSPEGTVLYCGTAITEILGWSETDIIDLHLNELINVEDQANFQRCFEDSIRTNHELLAYIRLKYNTAIKPNHSQPEDLLFEIKGYPHFVTEQGPECKCFFAMAKPYPSRNVAMLNTFLEEQMQNERLQQRLASLKARLNAQCTSTSQASMHTNATYPTSSYPPQYPGLYDELKGLNAYDNNLSSRNYNPEGLQSSVPMDDVDEGSRKKKLKRAHGTEQYVCVTCGRTDSPEWRKGPLGPKTLCNACGLRWAKQMRKFDEPNEGANQNGADGSGATGS